MKKIDDEMMDVLKKNMPEMYANAFTERLKELESENEGLVTDHKEFKAVNKDNLKEIDDLKVKVAELLALKIKKEYLESEDEKLKSKTIDLRIREAVLTVRETTALSRVNDHKEMMNTIFRNVETRREVFKSGSKINNYSGNDDNGNWIDKTTTDTVTDNETITESHQ